MHSVGTEAMGWGGVGGWGDVEWPRVSFPTLFGATLEVLGLNLEPSDHLFKSWIPNLPIINMGVLGGLLATQCM